MGSQTYPIPTSTGSSNSTYLPVNASSVLLDGQLVVSGTYSTTITGTGGLVYLYANDNNAIITISGTSYTVNSGTIVPTSAISGPVSVVISGTTSKLPVTFGVYNGPTTIH